MDKQPNSKDLDREEADWQPPVAQVHPERRPQLGIRHTMIALVYFAFVFGAARQAMILDGALQWVWVGLIIGLGLCSVGVWVAMTSIRYSWIGWTIFVVGYLTVMGSTINFFAIPTFPILVGAIIYLHYRKRATNQDAMLGVLTVAAESGIPLAPGVWAFSDQVSGMFEIWTEALGSLLRRGMSLPDAIESVPKVVPNDARILIRVGWEAGKLGAGLRESIQIRTLQAPFFREVGARIAYLIWVVLFGEFVVAFMLYFIVPKLEAIFKDFGVSLPPITIQFIQISHFIVDRWAVFAIVQVAVIIAMVFVAIGSGIMSIPGVDRFFRSRHAGVMFRALAVTIEAGRPVVPALKTMARWYPTGWVRSKLAHAAELAAQGCSWVEAMTTAGLFLPSDAGVLVAASRAGNLPWALRELAASNARRWGYQVQAWSQILFVLSMLVLGATVLVISMAYFLPLISLIERLSS